MASGSVSKQQQGQQQQQQQSAISIAEGLEKELRLRTEIGGNNAGSSVPTTPTSPSTSLMHRIVSALNRPKTSPYSANHNKKKQVLGYSPNQARGATSAASGSLGLSPPPSSDSHSSMSGGATPEGMEMDNSFKHSSRPVTSVRSSSPSNPPPASWVAPGSNNITTPPGPSSSVRNANQIASSSGTWAARTAMQTAATGAGDGGRTTTLINSNNPNGAAAKSTLSASAAVGVLAGKVGKPKRRSRASKRPQTQIINADPAEFRAIVQKLTGFPTVPAAAPHGGLHPSAGSSHSHMLCSSDKVEFPSSESLRANMNIVRPQPQRPLTITPMEADNSPAPSAALGSHQVTSVQVSTTPAMSSAQSSKAPAVPPSFPYRSNSVDNSSCTKSSAEGSGLNNYCMGYLAEGFTDSSFFLEMILRASDDDFAALENTNTNTPSTIQQTLYSSEDDPYSYIPPSLFNSSSSHDVSRTGPDSMAMNKLIGESHEKAGSSSRGDMMSGQNSSFSGDRHHPFNSTLKADVSAGRFAPKKLVQEMGDCQLEEDLECMATKNQKMVDSWLTTTSDHSQVRSM